MKYNDGREVKIGDVVDLWPGHRAVVVCIIDDGLAAPGYNIEDWAYLKRGVVFKSAISGDIRFDEPGEDAVFVERSAG